MSFTLLLVTALLYGGYGLSLLSDRPWMCAAFLCWGVANICMGMDAMQAR